MPNNCECIKTIDKGDLEQIEGDEIVSVEVFGGGNKFCHGIEMKLKSGKFLTIEKDMDIKYNVGAWVEVKINKKECSGQLFFNFFNKN